MKLLGFSRPESLRICCISSYGCERTCAGCRMTAASMATFLDAFQKVADLANNSHGVYIAYSTVSAVCAVTSWHEGQGGNFPRPKFWAVEKTFLV